MKKIIFIFILFFTINIVKAEQFTKAEYLEGEYVKMVSDEMTKTLTMQVIRDSKGYFVYCLEPFVLIDEEKTDYVTYEKDISGYKNLTEEQKRKVALIAYYGYGYSNRATDVWYPVTQMLIWKTVAPAGSEVYFTDTLGGEKTNKYIGHMNEILEDVEYHDVRPSFIKDYVVNYGDDLVITNYKYGFEVTTDDYDYVYNPSQATLTVKDVTKSGTFKFEKDYMGYLTNLTIFSSDDSQDLLKPGSVLNTIYTINVTVTKGSIMLSIVDDDSDIYTSESSLKDTCYEITKDDELIDKVCVKKGSFIYKSSTLPYGTYKVKQVSTGVGYEVDDVEYEVVIDGNNESRVVLNNQLIKNKIELNKYYCYNEACASEENAVFKVYDNKGLYVGSITTDSNGYGFLDVGYGTYTVEQDYGLDNYTFVDPFTVSVVSSSEVYHTDLFNYYIEEETGEYDNVLGDDEKLEDEEEEESVPVVPDAPDISDEEVESKDEDSVIVDNNKEQEEVVDIPDLPKDEILEEETSKVEDKVNNDLIDKDIDIEVEDIVEESEKLESNESLETEVQEEVLPPETGTRMAEFIKILYNVIMIIICSCKLKRFCYNI